MNFPVRFAVVTLLLAGVALLAAGSSTLSAAAPDVDVFVPFITNHAAQDAAHAFTSEQSGVVASGGGHILSVGPDSVPTYQDGTAATLALSIDVDATPPVAPPASLRLVSSPTNFGPENFAFNFPLTVRLPVAGVTDVSNVYFLRYDSDRGVWTRSLFAFDPDNVNAIESTVFTLGTMAAGQFDASAAAMHPQGGLYLPNIHCPIGAMDCFYYLAIESFTPLYPDEVPAGVLTGTVLRVRANVTGESPLPTGWLLPQGSYTFCYSALESPLTLTHLKKYTTPNPETVVINQPYACEFTRTCSTQVHPINQEGWGEASDDRPCAIMGGGLLPSDPATLGLTGDFQATLRWHNSSGNTTDVDLHLFGPNELHVWYSSKTSGDGSLRLDRDWKNEVGDAVENIYQGKDGEGKSIAMPPGSYTLKIVHYSGADGKPYQVRVIRNGAVSNFSGTISSGQTVDLMTFTVP